MAFQMRLKTLEHKINYQLDQVNDDLASRGNDFNSNNKRIETMSSGIKKYLIHKGDRVNFPKPGDQVSVQYTGRLESGEIFDTSIGKGMPFTFTVDNGQVIKGWDQVIKTMSKGQREMVYIPASLAYGAKGAGGGRIPPNANLIFDIRLLKINKASR